MTPLISALSHAPSVGRTTYKKTVPTLSEYFMKSPLYFSYKNRYLPVFHDRPIFGSWPTDSAEIRVPPPNLQFFIIVSFGRPEHAAPIAIHLVALESCQTGVFREKNRFCQIILSGKNKIGHRLCAFSMRSFWYICVGGFFPRWTRFKRLNLTEGYFKIWRPHLIWPTYGDVFMLTQQIVSSYRRSK